MQDVLRNLQSCFYDVFMFRVSLFLCLLVSAPVWADDMQSAQQAIMRGDYAEAYCQLVPLAKKGNSEAQYQLGWMYHNGYGLALNDEKAANWWARAAGKKIVDAQIALAMLYREGGVGVDKNPARAAHYLLEAVESGEEDARLLLSVFLDEPDEELQKRIERILERKPESLGVAAYTRTDKANLRIKPGSNARVVDTVRKGEKLSLIAVRNQWAHVVYLARKKIVWVHGDLVGVTQEE